MMLLDGSQNRKRYGSIQAAPERNSFESGGGGGGDSIGELKARVKHDLATCLSRMVDSVNNNQAQSNNSRSHRQSGYRDPSARENNDAAGKLRSLDRVLASSVKNRTFPACVQQQASIRSARLGATNQWLQSVKNSLCQSTGAAAAANLNQRKANGSRELKLRCQLSTETNQNETSSSSKRTRGGKKDAPRKNKTDSWPFGINKFSVSSLLPVLAFLWLVSITLTPTLEGAPIAQFGKIQPIWLENALIHLDEDEQQQQLDRGDPALSFVQAYRDEREKETPSLDEVLFDMRPERQQQQQQRPDILKPELKEKAPTWSPFGNDLLTGGNSNQEAAAAAAAPATQNVDRFWIERRRLDRNRALEPAPWMRAQPMRRAGYTGSPPLIMSENGDDDTAAAADSKLLATERQRQIQAIPERKLRKSPNEVYDEILRHLIDEAVQGRDFINEIYDELELRSKQSNAGGGGGGQSNSGDANSRELQQQLLSSQQSGNQILDRHSGLRDDSSAIGQDQLNDPDSALIIAGDEVGSGDGAQASAGAAGSVGALDSAATHSNLKAAYARELMAGSGGTGGTGEQSAIPSLADDGKSAATPMRQLQSPFNLNEQISGGAESRLAGRQPESFAYPFGESGVDSASGESQLAQRFASLNHAEPAFHVLEEIDQVDDDSHSPAAGGSQVDSSSQSQSFAGESSIHDDDNDDDTDNNSARNLMMMTTNPGRQMQSKRRSSSGGGGAKIAAAAAASALDLSQGQLQQQQLSAAKPNLVDLVGGLLTQSPRAAAAAAAAAGDYGNPTAAATTTATKGWLPSAAATAAAQMMMMRKNSENKIALHMIESGYLDREQLVQVATKLKSHLEQLVGLTEGSILGLYPINPQQLLIKLDTNRLNALQIIDMIENYDFARGFIVLSWPRGSQKNPLPILVAILNELGRESMPKAGGNTNLVLDDELTGGGGGQVDTGRLTAAGRLDGSENDNHNDDDDNNNDSNNISSQLAALEPFSSLDAVAQSARDNDDDDDDDDDADARRQIALNRPSLEIDVLQPGAIAMPTAGKSHISLATLSAILMALNANRLPVRDSSGMPSMAAISYNDDSSSGGGGGGGDDDANGRPTSQALIKDTSRLNLLDSSHLLQLSALMLAMLGAFVAVKLIMKGNDKRLLRRHFSRSSRSLRSFWSSGSSQDDDDDNTDNIATAGEQTTAGQVSGPADKCSKLGAANLDTKRHLVAETDSIIAGSIDSSSSIDGGDRKSLEQLARKLVNVLSGFSIARHQMPDADEAALEKKINPDVESGKSSKTDSGIEDEKLDEATAAPYRSSRSYIKALIEVLSKARPFSSGAACEQDDQEVRGLVADGCVGLNQASGGSSENSDEQQQQPQRDQELDEHGVLLSQMDITAAHLILSYMETHLDDKERLRREWLQLNASAGLNSSANESRTAGGSNAAKMNERTLQRLAKVALSEENRHKNRHPSLVPFDRNRVKLNSPTSTTWGQQLQKQQQPQQQPGKLRQRAPASASSSGDYINASYIYDDDPSRPTHIIAQGPSEQTSGHFWQMIWEQGISVIVMLTRLNENSVRQCHCYWPTNSSSARAAAAAATAAAATAASASDGGGQQTGPSGNVSAQSALQSHSLDDAAAATGAGSATNGNAKQQQQQQHQSAGHSNETTSAARRGSVTSVFNMAAACRPNGQKGQPIIANKELLSNVISFDVCSINSAAAAAAELGGEQSAGSNQAEEKPLSNHEQLAALKSKDQKKRVAANSSSSSSGGGATSQQSHMTKTIRFEVHLVSEHVSSNDYLVRNMCLVNRSTGETRTVTQFHYLAWPEGGVPENVKNFLQFRRKVHKSYRNLKSPILVHCSDGAGRSGTYTLIDIILERIRNGAKEIDPLATLEHLRNQRVGLCANQSQFEFVLMALAEEIQIILDALPQ